MQTGRQLRELFALIFGNETISDAGALWILFSDEFQADFFYRLRLKNNQVQNQSLFSEDDLNAFQLNYA